MNRPQVLPLLPLRGLTVFPHMTLHFDVSREMSVEALDAAMREADDFGRRVMGSRMKGAKPLGFESKTLVNQMLHVFQVEAANTFDYMLFSDMPQVKPS